MAKVVPEAEKNYNKFPGDHVIVIDDRVTIGDKTFQLVHNYRDGFNAEKLEQRFSDIFAKYDYVVGDWGHEQLRLKGFFSTSRRKMPDDQKITHLEDYIKEYMNFGAAFFVLKRKRAQDIKRDEAYVSEKVYDVKPHTTDLSKTSKAKVTRKETRKVVEKGTPKAKQSAQHQKPSFVKKEKTAKSAPQASQNQTRQTPQPEGKRPAFVVRTRQP